ncbi:hypothetical protein J4430_01905 [Candidatus Woesearchaeota archaeon]|nr:hypothetical protein [Candidatus Woesearchaeota archaeon]
MAEKLDGLIIESPWKGVEGEPHWYDVKSGVHPLRHYEDHYKGVIYNELVKLDPVLYYIISINPELYSKIPKRKSPRVFGDDPDYILRYYRDNYLGMSQGELRRADQSFYQILRKNGLLPKIPKESFGELSEDELVHLRDLIDIYLKRCN